MMDKKETIQSILDELRVLADQNQDPALRERVRQLESLTANLGGSISVGNISGSTAVAIGSDIQIILHQTNNLPNDLLTRLISLTDTLSRQADASPRAGGHIRVFLASPGDVKDERKLALKAIGKIAADPYYKNLNIEAIAWDKPEDSAPMLAGIDPQRAISEGLARPADCDICAVIFWSRMGTPLEHEKYQKADGSAYLSGTEWELENALAGFGRNGLPLTMVYRRTEKLLLDPDTPGFDEKVRQWRLMENFFNGFQNADGSVRLSYNAYASPSEFGDLFELHLRKLIAQVAEKKRPAVKPMSEKTVPALTWEKGKSPFPGLRAFFGAEDAKVFFGRGLETDLLLRRLSDSNCRFLTVVGASGSGKSSLVGAGLLPRIQEGALPGSETWLVATFTPDAWGDGNPFNALTWALSQPPFGMDARETNRRLRESPSSLRELLEARLAEGPAWQRAVLFIDQFEELFTRMTDEALRHEFSLLLSEAANSPRLLTVATMRDDFYHHCVKSQILSRLINRNKDSTFTLSAPGALELYEMITAPARVAGLEYEGDLPQRILKETGANPGALALMAFALDQLYKASDHKGKLALQAYQAFGGVQGAIGTRAQETFDKLSEGAKKTLPRVFRELLEVDENGTTTRKRAPLEQVECDAASRELIQALVGARLLTTSQGLVEVAHEALFRNWGNLKAWIEEAQDDLILLRQVRTAAEWWNKYGRKPEYLWLDERLKAVYEMQKRLEPNWNEHEKEFIRLEVERLWEEIENPKTSHRHRSWIGERLDTLGDPRPGVGLVSTALPLRAEEGAKGIAALRAGEIRLWGDKPEHIGLPDLVWLKVDGGSIRIARQTFRVQPFLIAKYPITYKQFEAFVEAEDGFKNPRWWEGLFTNADNSTNKPRFEQTFKFYNHPRENVSWYDTIAFCRWLDARANLSKHPATLSLKSLFTKNTEQPALRLPTEWEWQWAATGGNEKYKYPWGAEWDWSRANTKECGLARTTAVGMYLAGAAKCGALDMSGNVREWCLNEFSKPENIDVSGSENRAVRGGSWYDDPDNACIFIRLINIVASTRDGGHGFRLVVRPAKMQG